VCIDGELVVSEAKTERSRRTVPLHPGMVAMLTKHRTTQKADRLKAGDQWIDSSLVFTTETGGPVDPPVEHYRLDDGHDDEHRRGQCKRDGDSSPRLQHPAASRWSKCSPLH
jgi:hypothetical protein